MGLRKKEKSAEEIAEHKEAIAQRRLSKSFATKIKNNCRDLGLSVMREQLKFLKANPDTKLPTRLTYKAHVQAFEEGITMYVESLNVPAFN